MFRWFANTYFKEHIDNIVEKKFHEKLVESYHEARKVQLQKRIQAVRKTISGKASTETPGEIQSTKKTSASNEVLSSSNIRRKNQEPSTLQSDNSLRLIKDKLKPRRK